MLCYVTPKEHLGLPEVEERAQGVIAYKIKKRTLPTWLAIAPVPATATTALLALPGTISTGRNNSGCLSTLGPPGQHARRNAAAGRVQVGGVLQHVRAQILLDAASPKISCKQRRRDGNLWVELEPAGARRLGAMERGGRMPAREEWIDLRSAT